MIVINEAKEKKDFVITDDRVSYGGSECPCDHEGCSQDDCSLKT